MKSDFNHFHVCITRTNCFLAKKTRIPDEKEIDGNIHKILMKKQIEKEIEIQNKHFQIFMKTMILLKISSNLKTFF